MGRLDRLINITKPFLEDKMAQNLELLTTYFNYNREEIKIDFFNQLNFLYEMIKQQQDAGTKEPISYLTIAYLRSSLLTGTNHFRLDMYSNKFYLDKTECCIYWTPKFMFYNIAQDMSEAKEFIIKSGKISKLSEFDMSEVKYYYTEAHFALAGLFMKELIDIYMKETTNSNVDKPLFNEDFSVVYSGYMEKGITIYPISSEDSDENS